MKRIYLSAALLLCAAACAPAPADNANANANMSNMNAANANLTGAAAWTNDDVIANERQAWDSIKTKNGDALGATLDDNFINVTPLGVRTKAETVAYVKTFDLTDATLSDFKVVKLDNDAAVVAYTVSMKGSIGGKPIPANAPAERHGTAKLWRGGKWVAVYHQVTPVEPPMVMPPGGNANANAGGGAKNTNTGDGARNVNAIDTAKNANAAASPASTAPLTPTADAEANEKMIWDAFDKKNIDGFAGVLSEDTLEVEPDGVLTKAASVDMMRKMLDAGSLKATLSDFKTVPLDADAKIVTYVVKSNTKGFPPAGMRHSTVWVNRGGKWMAAYHQGTTIMKGM
ncbi:MAG TPA: nuclear transport factor 2 family protein [Pyrinomonadaceae bacterium]|jgi:hypothetical protein|nr:nuclear transport factor 2 family protein [Pyrinomonadaceae bacterium]